MIVVVQAINKGSEMQSNFVTAVSPSEEINCCCLWWTRVMNHQLNTFKHRKNRV